MPLSQFESMQGVNVHMEYGDGLYSNYKQVLSDLQYLGITHIRDGVNSPGYTAGLYFPDIEYLLDNGIFADMIISTQGPECGNPSNSTAACALPLNMQAVDTLLQHKAGSVTSVEGLNEINNEAGVTEAEAQAMQTGTYSATKADAGLGKSVPVLDFTGLNLHPAVSPGSFDQANIHPYPKQGAEPEATFEENMTYLYSGNPTAKAITEFGYRSVPDGGDGVNEFAQADMTLNGIMDAAADGYSSIYLYELLDAYAGQYYGLFHYDDGGPKLAATYIHNLNTVLPRDRASNPVVVKAIEVGLPGTARQVALTASNGDVYVFTWNEVNSWNVAQQTYTSPAMLGFYEQVQGTWSSVTLFSPALSGTYEVPIAAAGQYQGSNYYFGLYTNTPVCMHFHK
ncbi:hypothetical protein D1Y84_08670 [Acidipila sp. EB88]|nr:hypothetical protein D1Y84_08670 [Acidipila sp. EB88]